MAARKKAGGQTPEPTNRNHIGCSCGILPVAALLEFIGFHLIKNLMSAFMSESKMDEIAFAAYLLDFLLFRPAL